MEDHKIKKPTVFISHATSDAEFANAVKQEIEKVFADGVNVFCASHWGQFFTLYLLGTGQKHAILLAYHDLTSQWSERATADALKLNRGFFLSLAPERRR